MRQKNMPNKSNTIDGIVLNYASSEQETADAISGAIKKSLQLAKGTWGLGAPENCHIYVMTSPLSFVFRSAPWPWRILLAATLPLWIPRVARTWPYSAAWTQNYGKRIAIGVKSIQFLAQSERKVGTRMFIEENDPIARVEHVTCHELVHACSAHLKLPMWLNEGIATLAVDHYFEKQIIRQDTLDVLKEHTPKAPPPTYKQMSRMDLDEIVYNGIRSYWLVRYLEDNLPGFLKKSLSEDHDFSAIDHEMAKQLGIKQKEFWDRIDEILVGHFMTS
jgi:hypothetical protein